MCWFGRIGWFGHLVTTAVVVERLALGGGNLAVLVLQLQTLKVSAIGTCTVGLLRPQMVVGPHHVYLGMLQGGDGLG